MMRLSFDQSAFVLRIGLGLVFLAGGLAKLSKLLVPEKQADMVGLYFSAGEKKDPKHSMQCLGSFSCLLGVSHA